MVISLSVLTILQCPMRRVPSHHRWLQASSGSQEGGAQTACRVSHSTIAHHQQGAFGFPLMKFVKPDLILACLLVVVLSARYRDLLETADSIMEMSDLSHKALRYVCICLWCVRCVASYLTHSCPSVPARLQDCSISCHYWKPETSTPLQKTVCVGGMDASCVFCASEPHLYTALPILTVLLYACGCRGWTASC